MSDNQFKGKTGIVRIVNAFRYSLMGLGSAFRHESAFRQELVVAAIMAIIAMLLPATWAQRALLLSSLVIVMMIELLNSAIEATVDRVSEERHPLAKRAKDMGSAAVLLALVNCAIIWGLVLIDILI